MKPYPYTPEQRLWLNRLDTTSYPQTRGALHRVVATSEYPVGYCCLGIGAVTLNIPPMRSVEDSYVCSFEGSSCGLQSFDRLHLRSSCGEFLRAVPDERSPLADNYSEDGWTSLTELNDELGWSFHQIADFIRSDPWNVFTDPAARHGPTCLRAMDRRHICDCGFFHRDGGQLDGEGSE